MILLAFGCVCDVCIWDVRRAYCMRLHLVIVVGNHVETLHATNAMDVTTNVLVVSVRVVCEFARVWVSLMRMRLGCWTCDLCKFTLGCRSYESCIVLRHYTQRTRQT